MLQQAGFNTPATESVLIHSDAMIYEQLLSTMPSLTSSRRSPRSPT